MGNRERQPHSNAKAPRNWGERNIGPQANLRLAQEVGLTDVPAEVSPEREVLTRTSGFTDKHTGPDGRTIRRGLAEKAKKRPDSHTVRTKKTNKDRASEVLPAEKIKKIKGPKELVRLAGSMESKRRQKASIKPTLHERKHIDESTVATVITEEVELSEPREGEVVYEASESGLRAVLPGMDELSVDPLTEDSDSVENVVASERVTLPEEELDWADYGNTKVDHNS